ncbi:tubulin-tyrosine ligase [Echria macrotheca]|uniref:Tubulin-tyrosine ligase n=1 Tax=Echria macrotheca TaxID=438768 RepID=A0AAJ0B6T2_9PEZI|nr:tubulin-tyrosine ligase [Echria macrotheca]
MKPVTPVYAYVQVASPWLDEHLRVFIRHHAPDAIFVEEIDEIPSSCMSFPGPVVFQFCNGQLLTKNFALLNRTRGLINAYPNSDALARKDHLGAVVDYWTAKRPESILGDHIPQTVRLTLDYSEYVDEALMAADDLTLLSSLEKNDEMAPKEREWWILKPALVDCGAGIRIFSTVEELAGHLELAEYEDDENEESYGEESESQSEPAELEKNGHEISLSIPGLDSLDGLVLTTKPSALNNLSKIRAKKPEYVFREGGRIPSAQMRSFVAQRYIVSIPPIEGRKWHVRAYVLAIGRLQVHVFDEMLALLAGEDYQPPWEYPNLKSSLTNTALQDEEDVERRQSMRAFSDLPENLLPNRQWKKSVFDQICQISGELFRAAAHTMADKFVTLDRCFELFAVDFLVDTDGTAWLLEVNETPAFYTQGVSGPMALRLMESVICVAMEHIGLAHVGEARNAVIRKRMVEVLDETAGLGRSNITEILEEGC